MRTPEQLTFQAIDLSKHAELCVQFRRDSYACSFVNGAEKFDIEYGQEGQAFLKLLGQRIRVFPQGHVHVFLDDLIIGQLEMRLKAKELGYINLFYLAPLYRGKGYGDSLHTYAEKVMREAKAKTVQLSVSPGNHRALKYYQKHGWINLGPRPQHEEVLLMELKLGQDGV